MWMEAVAKHQSVLIRLRDFVTHGRGVCKACWVTLLRLIKQDTGGLGTLRCLAISCLVRSSSQSVERLDSRENKGG